jgi:hypothetical protein
MVIAYNQNLHFKIHCKKFQKQDYNSFHHNLTLQEIHTKDEHRIHYRSLCFFVENMNPNYNIIPCFVEKKISKQHLKYMLYQNRVYGFLPQVPLVLATLFPNSNFLSHLLLLSFSKIPPFRTILSHIIMIQSNKNSKFKLTKFPN